MEGGKKERFHPEERKGKRKSLVKAKPKEKRKRNSPMPSYKRKGGPWAISYQEKIRSSLRRRGKTRERGSWLRGGEGLAVSAESIF